MKINNVIPPVISTNSNEKQNVAFKGNLKEIGFKDVGQELLTLKREGPMSRNLFVINAFAFLLGTRIVTSRDKDEKREIFIRDIPTILIAVLGVPFIEKAVAKTIQSKTGFAFMKEDDKTNLFRYINKKLGRPEEKTMNVVSYGQLGDWYKFDKNLASGFKGFADRLDAQGGNLNKIFSSLGENIKDKLQGFGDDNKLLKAKLFDASEESKSLIKTLEEEFAKDKNKALKQASWAKTIPTLIGIGLTVGLVGFLIPKLNIAITETINKKRQAKTEEKPVDSTTSKSIESPQSDQSFSTNKTKKVFENFVDNK